VATNCWLVPGAMSGVAGVTVMDASECAGTVKVAVPWMLPEVAVIVDAPAATVVTVPLVELMVATEVLEEFQVTEVVMFWVELSE